MGTARGLKSAQRQLPSGTVTFLLTDIEGSTRRWQEHPDAMRVALARHDQLLVRGIEDHDGTVLTERGEGDSVFAVFARASDGLSAARSIQQALHSEAWPDGCDIRVRMALHSGEASEDYRGSAVNRCARLRSLARGGQVLVSTSVRALALDHLPARVSLKDFGEHQLRGLDRPERVYQLIDPDLPRVDASAGLWQKPWRWMVMAGVAFVLLPGVVIGLALLHQTGPTGPVISTVLGNGTQGYSADGTLASAALVTRPNGLIVTNTGEIYFADANMIRKTGLDGRVHTVAGTGSPGFDGDGGPAIQATLNIASEMTPELVGFAIDSRGDVFFSDTGNNRVREITPDKTIHTVAGNGATRLLGSPPPSDVGDGRPGIDAVLSQPHGLALDSNGHLFIADTGDNRVRMLDATTGLISTVAGDGSLGSGGDGGPASRAQLTAPEGLALDAQDNLFIVDSGTERIREVTNGKITTLAGKGSMGFSGDNGPATRASLSLPLGVAVDSRGNLYVADSGSNRVRKIDLSGQITTVAGNGQAGFSRDSTPATSAMLNQPGAVAVGGAADLYIADFGNNRILIVPLHGQ